MARLRCPCGSDLWNGQSPSPVMGHLFGDLDWEGVIEPVTIDGFSLACDPRDRSVWECDDCGRLAITMPDRAVRWYAPASGKAEHVLAERMSKVDE